MEHQYRMGNPYEQRDGGERKPVKFVAGKVFIGALPGETTRDALEQYCSKWGQIAEIHVANNKGFAFVTFNNFTDAQNFLDTRDHSINGRIVDAKAAVPKDIGGNKLTKKMFVGGVFNIDDQLFHSYFSHFGSIDHITVPRKPDGSCRGYGFVTFAEEKSVEKCLVQEHAINGHKLECKRAVPKDQYQSQSGRNQDQAQLSMQHMADPNMMAMMGMIPIMGGAAMMPMQAGMMGQQQQQQQQQQQGGRGATGFQNRQQQQQQQDKWTCQCGNTNLGWRQYCQRCNERRSYPGNAMQNMMPGTSAMMMMGTGGGGGGTAPSSMMNPSMMNASMMNPAMMNPAMMNAASMGGMMPGSMMPGMMQGGLVGMGGGHQMTPVGGMNLNVGGSMPQQQQQQGGTGGGRGSGGYVRGGGRGNGQNRFRPY